MLRDSHVWYGDKDGLFPRRNYHRHRRGRRNVRTASCASRQKNLDFGSRPLHPSGKTELGDLCGFRRQSISHQRNLAGSRRERSSSATIAFRGRPDQSFWSRDVPHARVGFWPDSPSGRALVRVADFPLRHGALSAEIYQGDRLE